MRRYVIAGLLGLLLGLAVCVIVERVASIAQAGLSAPGPESPESSEYVPAEMDY